MQKMINLIDKQSFFNDFVNAYLKEGFTNLPKKEIDLLFLDLLIKHHQEWKSATPDTFRLATALRIKRGKLRSMLDELSYRHVESDEQLKEKLKIILEKGETDILHEKVRIQIESSYLREYTKQIVLDDSGLVDTSFDKTIIVLTPDKYLFLVMEVLGAEKQKEFEKELKKEFKDKIYKTTYEGPLWKQFIKEVIKGAGNAIGVQAIKIGSAYLTGGTSEISSLVKEIRDFSEKINMPLTSVA